MRAMRVVDDIIVEIVEGLPDRVTIGHEPVPGGEPGEMRPIERATTLADCLPDIYELAPDGVQLGWVRSARGGFEPPPAPVPPPPDIAEYRRAIQFRVDEAAQSRNYDSGLTCASYAVSTHPVWSAEAQAFIAWRDQVWAYAYAELAKVEAGDRDQPSVAAFVAELPPLIWPA